MRTHTPEAASDALKEYDPAENMSNTSRAVIGRVWKEAHAHHMRPAHISRTAEEMREDNPLLSIAASEIERTPHAGRASPTPVSETSCLS